MRHSERVLGPAGPFRGTAGWGAFTKGCEARGRGWSRTPVPAGMVPAEALGDPCQQEGPHLGVLEVGVLQRKSCAPRGPPGRELKGCTQERQCHERHRASLPYALCRHPETSVQGMPPVSIPEKQKTIPKNTFNGSWRRLKPTKLCGAGELLFLGRTPRWEDLEFPQNGFARGGGHRSPGAGTPAPPPGRAPCSFQRGSG